ncbi:MAG: sugar transferase [Bacteroidetes bacterium]|nr:sugar transferase [Bacteroidota bacterium]
MENFEKRVFVIDSDEVSLRTTTTLLEKSGFLVVANSKTGENITEVINEKKPDIFLLEIFLRGKMDGIETAKMIKRKYKLPFIFLTSNEDYTTFLRAKQTGPSAYLTKPIEEKELTSAIETAIINKNFEDKIIKTRKDTLLDLIIETSGERALSLFNEYVDFENPRTFVVSTSTKFNIDKFINKECETIINLKRVNDIKQLNKFFESVNHKLDDNGIFIGCAETKELRKRRILKKYIPVFNYFYYTLDFILKRVFPKLPITKSIYFFLTNGRNRVFSRPEVLGRLYSCGFKVHSEQYINNHLFFVAEKVKEPSFDLHPSYGPLFSMKRVGKKGKTIYVKKFRTMHPYAEYLQEYVYEKNKLEEGGKFKNDFRISTVGRIFRKFWIDEFPMFINLFRGDIKLVGVRPLSEHYLSLYDEEFRNYRQKYKPGLVPPFYADMPKTLEEIVDSEKKYLELYEIKPFRTDIKYFFKAFYNIIFKNARSR